MSWTTPAGVLGFLREIILTELCVYLVVGELVPGLFPIGKYFPQHYSKAPDVTLGGELSVHDAFRWHPADRQHGVTAHL